MDRDGPWEPLFGSVAALAMAIVLSFVVRSFTVELNHSVGHMWPFSMARCQVASTPGCGAAEAEIDRTLQAQR